MTSPLADQHHRDLINNALDKTLVVEAAAGTGKTTVVERLVEVCPDLEQSRSYTSRPAREKERDGVDYNFVSRSVFDRMIEDGQFLEWADVFGNRYGTARAEVTAKLERGQFAIETARRSPEDPL